MNRMNGSHPIAIYICLFEAFSFQVCLLFSLKNAKAKIFPNIIKNHEKQNLVFCILDSKNMLGAQLIWLLQFQFFISSIFLLQLNARK